MHVMNISKSSFSFYLFSSVVIFIVAIYSYALIDPNLTLFNSYLWVKFRDPLVYFGYYHRGYSMFAYSILIVALYVIYKIGVKNYRSLSLLKITGIISLVLLFSYPFLSHDFFNYIFDAKILTFYGQNPYTTPPSQFQGDEWLRFMHWVHRPYPYGPTFLAITLIPSYLAMGKFILSYFFFKLLSVIFYVLGVYYLQKMERKAAFILALHPLVIVEGLVNAHNDLLAVSFGIIGIYYLLSSRCAFGRMFLIISAGIKYLSLPLVILISKNKLTYFLALCGQLALLLYLSFAREIQPWYFLSLFTFLPFYKSIIFRSEIFLFSLLMSYYPYIYLGGWDKTYKVVMKHQIIWLGLFLNLIFMCYLIWKERRNIKLSLLQDVIGGNNK